MHVALAGGGYCLVLFGLGFLLGALRVTVVAPRIGVVAATALEAVPMLAAMAWVAPRLARWQRIPSHSVERVAIGFLALALLVAVEITLAGPGSWLENFATPQGMIYAALLLAFAAIPWIRA